MKSMLPKEITRYLDQLSDEKADRVIHAQRWTSGTIGSVDKARCLVGHAEGVEDMNGRLWDKVKDAAMRFDTLYRSGGQDTVTEIKAYLGKRNEMDPTGNQQQITANAAAGGA